MQTLFVVLGTTASGKSRLGVDLALALGGCVINGDSMQVYKGCDVVTNKIPLSEQRGVEHSLLSFLSWQEEYQVGRFVKDAGTLIDKYSMQGKHPIVVGGTHYYIQSLLFKESLIGPGKQPLGKEPLANSGSTLNMSNYHKLELLDPESASRLHPNDERKICRALQILQETGIPKSRVISQQSQSPRYRTCIFWVYSRQDALNARLNKRVDDMMQSGLLDELRALQDSKPTDISRGIYQIIGYKQFIPYLEAKTGLGICIERFKSATRKYAKRQIQWIRNTLVGQCKDLLVPMYIIDSSEPEKWDTVSSEACRIASEFANGNDLPTGPCNGLDKLLAVSDKRTKDKTRYVCETCALGNQGLVIVGQKQWEEHITSKRHAYRTRAQKKWEKVNMFIEKQKCNLNQQISKSMNT